MGSSFMKKRLPNEKRTGMGSVVAEISHSEAIIQERGSDSHSTKMSRKKESYFEQSADLPLKSCPLWKEISQVPVQTRRLICTRWSDTVLMTAYQVATSSRFCIRNERRRSVSMRHTVRRFEEGPPLQLCRAVVKPSILTQQCKSEPAAPAGLSGQLCLISRHLIRNVTFVWIPLQVWALWATTIHAAFLFFLPKKHKRHISFLRAEEENSGRIEKSELNNQRTF